MCCRPTAPCAGAVARSEPGSAIEKLARCIGMTGVARRLLNEVHEDPPEI